MSSNREQVSEDGFLLCFRVRVGPCAVRVSILKLSTLDKLVSDYRVLIDEVGPLIDDIQGARGFGWKAPTADRDGRWNAPGGKNVLDADHPAQWPINYRNYERAAGITPTRRCPLQISTARSVTRIRA